MKIITLLLALMPIISFSQVSSWRTNTKPVGQQPRTYSSPSQSYQSNNNISSWRTPSQPKPIYTPKEDKHYNRNYNYNYRNPRINYGFYYNWGFNNWYNWGAPIYGYRYWEPYWYYDNFGYRQPSRVYIYENGKQDTIKGVKPNISIGLQYATNGEYGIWWTIGRKNYFILEYNQTVEKDNSTYYPNGQFADVDFPLVNDLEHFRSIYIGIGKRFGRTGAHLMVGNMHENVKWRGKDDVGYITFPKYVDNYMTFKIGATHDLKGLSLKYDYDLVVKKHTFGAGFNF